MKVLDLDAVRAAPTATTPYPHFTTGGALKADAVPALMDDFPAITQPGFFPIDDVPVAGSFAALLDDLQSPEFSRVVGEKLGMDLASRPTLITVRKWSRASDGTQTPTELVQSAARAGLDVVALTDHDTAAGWPEAAGAAAEAGVSLVPGIEISTRHHGRGVHLLAYLPDPTYPPLVEELLDLARLQAGKVELDREPVAAESLLRTAQQAMQSAASERQLDKVERMKKQRDGARVARALDALRTAAASRANTMPPILEAVRAYATLGEMCDALRDVWGEYEEVPVI